MIRIDGQNWARKEYFDFFSQFDEPFFGIVTDIDCSAAYNNAKNKKHSFFAYYLHKSLVAINQIPEFKYRIVDDGIVLYDTINASPTIGRDDGTFGFGFIPYHEDFSVFNDHLTTEIHRIQNSTGLGLNNNIYRNDVIHYSSVPWIKFTGLTHARNFKFADSIPKISFGKASEIGTKRVMPISINVHHGFTDGFHVAKYVDLFQQKMNSKFAE